MHAQPPAERRPTRRPLLALALLAALAPPAAAQQVSGSVYDDRNANGLRDPGEPGLDGVDVTAWGAANAASTVAAAGAFQVDAAPGCQDVQITLPGEPDPALGVSTAGWRRSLPDQTWCPPDGAEPAMQTRYGVAEHLRQNLLDGGFKFIQLGDSIAAGVSFCGNDTDYSDEVAGEIECLGGAPIMLDNRAVPGWHSEDLLTPRYRPTFISPVTDNPQFIPNVVAAAPDLVTISIGGNDFLNTEPATAAMAYPYAQPDLDRSFAELVNTRRTVQEILATLTSELPLADVEINTVYDNLSPDCATTDFHAAAPAMWNQMLRVVAWGQRRPASIAEVALDFAHQDILRTTCCGSPRQVCTIDGIHPTPDGAKIIQHAIMESLGRVLVPAAGASGFDLGYDKLVATLAPSATSIRGGTVQRPDDALAIDGGGARVLPGGALVLSGFALPPDIAPSRVIVGVRYRTTGTFTDDTHHIDASFVDFAAPVYSFTGWDTVSPLVGASGTQGNIAASVSRSVVNALPNVPSWREVTAAVTLNAVDDGRVTGYYTWPAPSAADIANLKVRLAVEQVGSAADPASLEIDGAWAWVYGSTSTASGTPPGEVSPPGSPTPLLVRKESPGARLTWGAEPLATDYRVYRGAMGAWTGARAAPPVGGCTTATTFLEPFPADASGNWFWLVAAHDAAGEGPLGRRSDGVLRTAAGTTCP